MPRNVLKLAALLLALAALPASAGWLDALVRTGGKGAKAGAGSLETVAGHIKGLPSKAEGAAIAAEASHQGHWRFVNRAGETMTAATPEELARALAILAPEAGAKPGARLAVHLTEASVFQHRAQLKDLPKGAELHVMVEAGSYRLLRTGDGSAIRLFAEVRPRLVVELVERHLFDEAIWQLARPLNKANIRIVALEPGGPGVLASTPRIDAATRRALTDTIDPDRLRHTLPNVRGQTVLVTGRVDGELLHFKPASGPERQLLIRDLTTAADAADVKLIILRSSSPRQPGARNWLWRKAEVQGLDSALERATTADFLEALGAEGSRLAVTASPSGALRTTLEMAPARGFAGEPAANPIAGAFNEILSEVTAKVVLHGVSAHNRSAERDRELDGRLVPGIPSDIQIAWLGGLLLGLVSWPVTRGWWRRLWPAEARAEYGNGFGYGAARALREVAFAVLFLPFVGAIGLIVLLAKQGLAVLTAPFRLLRRHFSTGAAIK